MDCSHFYIDHARFYIDCTRFIEEAPITSSLKPEAAEEQDRHNLGSLEFGRDFQSKKTDTNSGFWNFSRIF